MLTGRRLPALLLRVRSVEKYRIRDTIKSHSRSAKPSRRFLIAANIALHYWEPWVRRRGGGKQSLQRLTSVGLAIATDWLSVGNHSGAGPNVQYSPDHPYVGPVVVSRTVQKVKKKDCCKIRQSYLRWRTARRFGCATASHNLRWR
jgi:hypothetical protein